MNITELKRIKTVKAIRRNNNFKSNEQKIKEHGDAIRGGGWEISRIENRGGHVYFSAVKNETGHHKWYSGKKPAPAFIQRCRDYCWREQLPITREYQDGDFYVIETSIQRKESIFILNRPEMDTAEIPGVLHFRSKDYIFTFQDADGWPHNLYGVAIKKDMLHGNVIHYENDNGVNIDYILEI
jgi:hypothetical protein